MRLSWSDLAHHLEGQRRVAKWIRKDERPRENGDLVIVNVFSTTTRTRTSVGISAVREAVGLSGSELEHLEVLKVTWAS